MINKIIELYSKYLHDLIKVRAEQKALINSRDIYPQFDDLEAEITYLLIRDCKPSVVIEISPCYGWSTSWILRALRDNGMGHLYSYDIHDTSKINVPVELTDRWTLKIGDAKDAVFPTPDYLFIDSEHTLDFANWYIDKFFVVLQNTPGGIPCSVHDVYHWDDPNSCSQEGGMVVSWLEFEDIPIFTASKGKSLENYNAIMELKKKLGIDELIHSSTNNPAIFFTL